VFDPDVIAAMLRLFDAAGEKLGDIDQPEVSRIADELLRPQGSVTVIRFGWCNLRSAKLAKRTLKADLIARSIRAR
jgi:hypothetical protein